MMSTDTKSKKATKKTTAKKSKTNTQQHEFGADVSRLLYLVANALYSEKEIFIRELISNAADACDKRRYRALNHPALLDEELEIALIADKEARTLSFVDNGIGMNEDELIANLGTIARSGTKEFMDNVNPKASAEDQKANLIGQFGVGFYSSFMVAKEVTVISRPAGGSEAWQWSSDGQGAYTIAPAQRDKVGTTITLHLHDGEDEYLERARLTHIIKTYSDHVAFPIHLLVGDEQDEDDDPINEASALWTRSKSDITEEQYCEFYRQTARAYDEPWQTIHFKAEGSIVYTGLLFIPQRAPFDLFHPERKSSIKLYVNKVFITDHCEEVLPGWLRFLKGVVDSEDLPLNISREMLQNQPILQKIKKGITSKILSQLERCANAFHDGEDNGFADFWNDFGAVVKEGVYEDHDNRDKILKLCHFHSSQEGGIINLDHYIAHMKDGQEHIYYITGESQAHIENSPQLEGFRAKGINVLFFTDPVDEFWLSQASEYEGKKFISVTRAGSDDLDKIDGGDEAKNNDDDQETSSQEELDQLVQVIKETLGEHVADVRISKRLTSSAVCLVADDSGLDMHIERMLKAHNQLNQVSKKILEINPNNAVIKNLLKPTAQRDDVIHLLLDQALIQEGEQPLDLSAFSQRMSQSLSAALS
jgi:molecular chaperone HtpG